MSGKCATALATTLSQFRLCTNGHNSSYYPSHKNAQRRRLGPQSTSRVTFSRCVLGKYDASSCFGCLPFASLLETMCPITGTNQCRCLETLFKKSLPQSPKSSASRGGGRLL